MPLSVSRVVTDITSYASSLNGVAGSPLTASSV